jgi:hypothetical protein
MNPCDKCGISNVNGRGTTRLGLALSFTLLRMKKVKESD